MNIIENDETAPGSVRALTHLLVAVAVLYVAGRVIVHAMHHHFFLEPDSIGYVSLGTNIFKGKGFVDFSGDWCSDWPPLYPVIIGLCQFITQDSVLCLGIVGGICLASTLLITHIWIGKLTKSPVIQAAVTIAIALSVPLTNLANSGLSETLFIPLTLVCLYFAGVYLETRRLAPFIACATAALLCCLTRYIGTTVVAAVAMAFLLSPALPPVKKFIDIALLSATALIPFFGWCELNKHFSGTMMGDRESGYHTFHQCFVALWSCMQDWLVVPWFPACIVAVALIGLLLWRPHWRDSSISYQSSALFFILFYTATVVWSSARYNVDMIDDRLAAPLFVPLMVLSAGLIDHVRAALVRPVSYSFTAAVVGFFVVVVLESSTIAQIPDGGYLSNIWQYSSTLSYVRNNAFADPMLSNDSAATFLLGQKETNWVADDYDTPTMAYVESQLDQVPANNYVVWLYNAIQPADFNPHIIVSKCDMHVVAQFNDGVIFRRNDDSATAST